MMVRRLCLMLNCTTPCTNSLSQLHSILFIVAARFTQPSLLDGYFIIRKYNELSHRERAQMNINSDKNI
jgi:hypothetical protein